MADNRGRYFSARDLKTVHSFNSELLSDIIQELVVVYKLTGAEIDTNIYGEADTKTGKVYYQGVQTEALIEFADSTTNYDQFGPDKQKTIKFKFVELFMKQINLYPETGDIISWDDQYYEIGNVIQEQYVGGQPGKQHSIITETHLTRVSNLNLVDRK